MSFLLFCILWYVSYGVLYCIPVCTVFCIVWFDGVVRYVLYGTSCMSGMVCIIQCVSPAWFLWYGVVCECGRSGIVSFGMSLISGVLHGAALEKPLPRRPRGALHRTTPEGPVTSPPHRSPSPHRPADALCCAGGDHGCAIPKDTNVIRSRRSPSPCRPGLLGGLPSAAMEEPFTTLHRHAGLQEPIITAARRSPSLHRPGGGHHGGLYVLGSFLRHGGVFSIVFCVLCCMYFMYRVILYDVNRS